MAGGTTLRQQLFIIKYYDERENIAARKNITSEIKTIWRESEKKSHIKFTMHSSQHAYMNKRRTTYTEHTKMTLCTGQIDRQNPKYTSHHHRELSAYCMCIFNSRVVGLALIQPLAYVQHTRTEQNIKHKVFFWQITLDK